MSADAKPIPRSMDLNQIFETAAADLADRGSRLGSHCVLIANERVKEIVTSNTLLVAVLTKFEESAWDGDPRRREECELCIAARAAIAMGKAVTA